MAKLRHYYWVIKFQTVPCCFTIANNRLYNDNENVHAREFLHKWIQIYTRLIYVCRVARYRCHFHRGGEVIRKEEKIERSGKM